MIEELKAQEHENRHEMQIACQARQINTRSNTPAVQQTRRAAAVVGYVRAAAAVVAVMLLAEPLLVVPVWASRVRAGCVQQCASCHKIPHPRSSCPLRSSNNKDAKFV